MDTKSLEGVVSISNGRPKITNLSRLQDIMDNLVYDAVFTSDDEKKRDSFLFIKELAKEAGAIPSSIQSLYEELGK